LICTVFRRHLDLIVVAVFGTMIVSTIALPIASGGVAASTGALPKTLNDLPPVIHIILDEHIGLGGLPAGLEQAEAPRQAMPEVYEDFALYSHAYSRFAETKYSLTSLMNRDVGADVGKLIEGDLYTFAPRENDWFDRLKKQGYEIKVYQSAWFDMCDRAETVDACYTYSFFSPNAIQRAPLSTGQRLRALTRKLFIGRGALQLEPMVAMEALGQFRSDIAETPRGVAYIVHLLIPHFGYLYGPDCVLLDPSLWEREEFGEDHLYTAEERIALYRRYLPQLRCADQQMAKLFEELKELGIYREATIIVHGDHGSRIGERPYITEMPNSLNAQDKVDHYATLLAIKAPGIAPGLHSEPVALQHVFAETFLGGRRAAGPKPGEIFIRTSEEDEFAALQFAWPDMSSERNILSELRR
jgi:hypothetical protein